MTAELPAEGFRPLAARQRTLHMVGNSHLDPVWLWPWQEGYQEARATFWSAIQRMEACGEFQARSWPAGAPVGRTDRRHASVGLQEALARAPPWHGGVNRGVAGRRGPGG